MNRDNLINIIREIMEGPLESYGFQYDETKFEFEIGRFGFFKKAKSFDWNLFIEIQPSVLSEDDIIRFFINLCRTEVLDLHDNYRNIPGEITQFFMRLAPVLFQTDFRSPVWEWYVPNEEKARLEVKDALEKLIIYGIPLLEDPHSTVDFLFGRN